MDERYKLKQLYKKYSELKYPDLIKNAIKTEQEANLRLKNDNLLLIYLKRKKFLINYRHDIKNKIDKLYDEQSALSSIIKDFSNIWYKGELIYNLNCELHKIERDINKLDALYRWNKTCEDMRKIEGEAYDFENIENNQ